MKTEGVPEILVICLSPAVDRNYSLAELFPGGFHRCSDPVVSAGGKGVNVARVLSILGAEVHLTGFFAGNAGKFILEDLKSHGIYTEPVFLDGETRSSINILEVNNSRETEILEQGPAAGYEDLAQIADIIERYLRNAGEESCVVFSGGLTSGLSSDTYAYLIGKAKSFGAKCFLDTSAEALMSGVTAEPFFIKPNIREFSAITGYMPSYDNRITDRDISDIALASASLDIPVKAITLSDKGAVLCTDDSTFFAHPLPVIPVNTIGSGDSFTAGFAFAVANGEDHRSALSLAVACAASNAVFDKVGYVSAEQVRELRQQVIINEYKF